jgi:hypothetical protein
MANKTILEAPLSLSLSYSRNRQPLNEMDDLTTHRQTTVFFFSLYKLLYAHIFVLWTASFGLLSSFFFLLFFFLVVVFDPKEFPTD